MRRWTLAFVAMFSGCALLGRTKPSEWDIVASNLLIAELKTEWKNARLIKADSNVVVIQLAPTCAPAECATAKPPIVPRAVIRFVSDSLRARFATVPPNRVCDGRTPRPRCAVPGAPAVLTMRVPPLIGDTIIVRSSWERSGSRGYITNTVYIWRGGRWIFPGRVAD